MSTFFKLSIIEPVQVYNRLSPPISITSDVSQCCPASPFLLDDILESVLDKSEPSTMKLLPDDRLRYLDYAEGTAVICDSS